MIISLRGKTPKIAESAYISQAASVIGDVEIGENSSVWPGAVVRADFGKITIGKNVVVEDNCVIHSGTPATIYDDVFIGDNVHVGHGAVLNCKKVGDNVLIGMNSTLLHEAEVGNFCIIGANCLVSEGMKVPDKSFVVGIPGKIKGEITEKQAFWFKEAADVYIKLAREYKESGL